MSKNESALSGKHIVVIALLTFGLAVVFSFTAELISQKLHSILISFIFLIVIILIHVIFDIIGVAATAAGEASLHAKAAKRIMGAPEAVMLVRNADKVANISNDVIGDITATVSGALGIALALQLSRMNLTLSQFVMNILITACIAAVTVVSKAYGKKFAITHADDVIFLVGKFLFRWEQLTGIHVFKKASKSSRR